MYVCENYQIMQKIKRIALGLDLTDMDHDVVRFASFIAKRYGASEIYFIHVIKDVKFPDEILKDFPDIEDKVFSEKESQLQQLAENYLEPDLNVKVINLVKKGRIAKNVLKIIDANNIDIVIIGKSVHSKERGLLAMKLARLSNCQLLIVPRGCTAREGKLLVPIDHSENDKFSIQEAFDIARNNGRGTELVIQVLYSVPNGYHYTGKSFSQFAEISKKHAKEKLEKILAKLDTEDVSFKTVYSLDKNDNPIDEIYDTALGIEPDEIILSAKGRTSTTALFLSSIAEKLIQLNNRFPLRIIRKKNSNAGIMEMIKQL